MYVRLSQNDDYVLTCDFVKCGNVWFDHIDIQKYGNKKKKNQIERVKSEHQTILRPHVK